MIVPVSNEVAHDRRALRIRLAANPASVPGARRFVAEGLRAWGHEDLVDDATLCVSELAGNAALHARSTYIEVCVLDLDEVVRLWVEDDGPALTAAIVPRTSLPNLSLADAPDDLDLLLDAPATGRGLAIVSVLASDWGVEELAGGKRVWADLPRGDRAAAGPAPSRRGSDARPPSVGPGEVTATPDALPEGWVLVRLSGCPVQLSLRQDQHLDELVRELTLISVGGSSPEAAELADRLEAILRAPAHARAAGRRQSQAALERGESTVDVEMAMPRAFGAEVRRLHAAVHEADVLCDDRRLLTLSSSPEIRNFRDWMTEEITAQIEYDAEPVTWADWLSRR